MMMNTEPTTGWDKESERLWDVLPRMEHIHHTPLSQTQGSLQKRAWKECKSQREWETIRNCLLDTERQLHIGSCGSMHRSVLSQARPNPNMERGIGHKVLLLAEEQLVTDSCWLGVKGGEEGWIFESWGEKGLIRSKHIVLNSQKANKNTENKTFSLQWSYLWSSHLSQPSLASWR